MVVMHYEEALYQVYAPLPLPFTIGSLPILPHQTNWFFDYRNLCWLHGLPDDVVEMTAAALLSRCTSPAAKPCRPRTSTALPHTRVWARMLCIQVCVH